MRGGRPYFGEREETVIVLGRVVLNVTVNTEQVAMFRYSVKAVFYSDFCAKFPLVTVGTPLCIESSMQS